MPVVGVDLAWGARGRTGLCAVQGGQVVASTVRRHEADVAAWIAGWDAAGLVVAIDAPLVVRNRTGSRGCERVLGAVYRAEEAGAYPANRTLPAFRDGGRARRLATRLGLSVDPAVCGRRRRPLAIEVYPHTALVSLFGLPRTLKYKRRPGRTWPARRRELRRLLGCLRDLAGLDPPLDVTTGPRWRALAAAVNGGDGPVPAGVEDELDAHVCAYVGLYHLAWRGVRSFAIGDAVSGYIVTPVDPGRLAPLRARAAALGVPVTVPPDGARGKACEHRGGAGSAPSGGLTGTGNCATSADVEDSR